MPPKKRKNKQKKYADESDAAAAAARVVVEVDHWAQQRRCAAHPTEPLVHYCNSCEAAVCPMCPAEAHDGHALRTLHHVTTDLSRKYHRLKHETAHLTAQLEKLKAEVAPQRARLHAYVDDEVAALLGVVEERRRRLHEDVASRAQRMRDMLDREAAVCEAELRAITDGHRVLNCIAAGSGTVEGEAGLLVSGKVAFDDFVRLVNPPLHDAPRMLHLLGCQLPVQDLQEMCDLLDWTQASKESAEMIFPVAARRAESSGWNAPV